MEVSRLIAEVHHRPELWDRQHPQHHNRSVLDHHWDSVADLLGITGKRENGMTRASYHDYRIPAQTSRTHTGHVRAACRAL